MGTGAAALFVSALLIRLIQHHAGLLYPDGYQYLLMARGISEHFRPTTVLGLGGDRFVPNADAAAKPFFPLVVAEVHAFGVPWLQAARGVNATAGAATVLGTALLAARMSGSALAGGAAGLLVLASPGLSFWSGYSGPDSLAQALALGAALAFAHRWPRLGGILTGLALATRPELVVVAAAGAIVAIRGGAAREAAKRGAVAALLTLVCVFASLRPPIGMPDLPLVVLGVLLVAAVGLVTKIPPVRKPATLLAAALLGVAGIGALAAPGVVQLWHHEWPLLGLAAAGLALLARDEVRHPIALRIAGISVLLGAVYVVKNPALERYFVLEIPLAALLVGLALVTLPHSARTLAVGLTALAVVGGFLRPLAGNHDRDMFAAVARRLSTTLSPSDSLVTAAPDAYGFWLPRQQMRAMRTGLRGKILLDAAQRSYAPRLTGRGRIIARFEGEFAFSRPDGEIDPGSARLVDGTVVGAH